MQVVSNTSPVSNLAIIDRLDLLKRRYGTVRIPASVAQELSAFRHPAARKRISDALAEHLLVVETKPPTALSLPMSLDCGETDAIALALAIKADVLLMDERRGREVARHFGLTVAGVLGELLHARRQGLVSQLRKEVDRLRAEAHFFIDPSIEKFILSQVGE